MKISSPVQYYYKLYLDGLDFISKPLGGQVVNKIMQGWIRQMGSCNVTDMQDFVDQCNANLLKSNVPLPVPRDWVSKYKVGYFKVEKGQLPNRNYFLFSEDWLSTFDDEEHPLFGLEFYTVPSYDRDGNLNEIAFRIIDQSQVHGAFKWLFSSGQQSTFGLQNVDPSKPVYVVEGAWDYMALTESGEANVVGLGSVLLTDLHKKNLKGLDIVHCMDMDTYGISTRSTSDKYCFFTPSGKDPYDAYQKHGYTKLLKIK